MLVDATLQNSYSLRKTEKCFSQPYIWFYLIAVVITVTPFRLVSKDNQYPINSFIRLAIEDITKYAESENRSFESSLNSLDNPSFNFSRVKRTDFSPVDLLKYHGGLDRESQYIEECPNPNANACFIQYSRSEFKCTVRACNTKSTIDEYRSDQWRPGNPRRCIGYYKTYVLYLTEEEIKYVLARNDGINSGRTDIECRNPFHDRLQVDYNTERIRCGNYIVFPSRKMHELIEILLQDGFDLDPKGTILTDRSWPDDLDVDTDIYPDYRYAHDVVEMFQYILLHEYAHACGMREQASENYAASTILALRKSKLGYSFKSNFLPEDFQETIIDCYDSEDLSFIYSGLPKPSNSQSPKEARLLWPISGH